jgi:roadblock/LC7 domain-containing protein
MYRDLLVVTFATLGGFAASGIFANLYRLIARKPETAAERISYLAVMVVAGPNVLFENAANSFKAKDCSRFAFWLATSISAYWSFMIGLIVLQLTMVKWG